MSVCTAWYSNVKCRAPQGQEGGGVVNVTATSAELIGLRPGSTYTISVRAYTAAGPGKERRLTVVHTKKNKAYLFILYWKALLKVTGC